MGRFCCTNIIIDIFSGMKGMIFKEIKNYVLILIAILSAGMGIKGYLLSSRFIDGGVTGISMLLNNILGYPLSILIPLINLPFIILGYYQMGYKFALKSSIAIAGLALCIAFMPYPNVTPDKLLTALFGGFFPWIRHRVSDSCRSSFRWY